MSTKRKYEKKSPYWGGKSKNPEIAAAAMEASLPMGVESGTEMSFASSDSGASRSVTTRRKNSVTSADVTDELANIEAMSLPYNSDSGVIQIREAIVLCQKAYANIGLFRNAVDIMGEFSSTKIRVKGGNKESRKFVQSWLTRAKVGKFSEQYFREYYRSGNTFIYKLEGDFDLMAIKEMSKVFAAEGKTVAKKSIPLKYTIINPANIVLQGVDFTNNPVFKKILSKYEIDALRSPKTPDEQAIFDKLPADVKAMIKKGATSAVSEIYMPIESKKLYTIFYKKQDYEPFAVPFGYPVLKDFNFKLELKKIDLAIARTIQNATLLITMGAEKDKGGINPRAMQRMQEIFASQSVARVVVSDFTTKGEFLIPEIGTILDPKKYEIVERDIREGLMLLVGGDGEKFSNQEAKVKIFIERLNEGRRAFIDDFLQPEVKKMCKDLGFKNYPTVFMEEIKFRDEVQFNRIYTRLLELGVITPTQMFDAVESGVLPDDETLLEGQAEYIKQREAKMFNPLVAGTPLIESAEGKATRKSAEKMAAMNPAAPPSTKKPVTKKPAGAPNPNSPNNGRPHGANGSFARLKEVTGEFYKIVSLGETAAKKMFAKAELSDEESKMVVTIAEGIFGSSTPDKWASNMAKAFEAPESIERDADVMDEVNDLAVDEDLDLFAAAILFHSRNKKA